MENILTIFQEIPNPISIVRDTKCTVRVADPDPVGSGSTPPASANLPKPDDISVILFMWRRISRNSTNCERKLQNRTS